MRRWGVSLALMLLAGCGATDQVVVDRGGVLRVTQGGSGSIFFPATQTSLSLANSVTVAVRGPQDDDDQFTVYTFFGIDALDFQQVPSAALVAFFDGVQPNDSLVVNVPSSVVSMTLHTGFDQDQVVNVGGVNQVLAQDAPVIYEQTSSGSVVLEPRPTAEGGFGGQASDLRRLRYVALTMTDLDTGATALVQGSANIDLSTNIAQTFYGYIGNLGLDARPPISGGGPPPPPGTTGSGGTGGTGGNDQPPAPPL